MGGITGLLDQALMATSANERALANDLANMDTPGFQASTMDFASALSRAIDQHAPLDQVTPDKIMLTGPQQLNGNTVDLNVVMTDLSKNGLTADIVAKELTGKYQTYQRILQGAVEV